MNRLLPVIALLALLGWWLAGDTPVELGPGVHAAEAPLQQTLDDAPAFNHNDYRITPLATFSIRAKVLSREDYRLDREADLAPIDLALGWGRMSDESVLDALSISQSGRWYRWRTEAFPIPRREIETHSANMHLIPADAEIGDILAQTRRGQIVELNGLLVRADGDDGWRWISSLRRTDSGARSCELVYVQHARIVAGE